MLCMKKVSLGRRMGVLAVAGAMALSMGLGAAPAFADNGVQDGTQTYDSDDAAWNPASNTGQGGGGQIEIIYSTQGGSWEDPGADPTVTSDNVSHDNGSYVVILPKLIKYENMAIGAVSTSDNYNVIVRGALPQGKNVKLEAQTGQALATTAGDGGITEATTIVSGGSDTAGAYANDNFRLFTAEEAFGAANTDGSLSGTTVVDNIALSGVAKAAGTYSGTVQYTSSLVDAS